jgi:3-oxoadipate enol-lactonase
MPYADIGAISLYFEDTGETGEAPPVLLLHELGGGCESWRAAIPLLAKRRRVIAMDFRCAGRSEKPTGPFEMEDLADDAAALLFRLGVAVADVAGAALGSLIGVLLAARHPARVRRLAMFAVADDASGRTAAYLSERAVRVRQEGMRAVADASLANAFPEAFATARTHYRPLYLGNDPAGYAALSLALARARIGTDVWDAVRAPCLVVSGAHDFIWPPASGREVADRIAGARFEILADSGHFPHIQTPADVAAMADGFFPAQGVL